MKVLLLSPPFKKDYMRNARCDFVSQSHTQWYPILLGSAGALLEKHGHETRLVDAPAENLSERAVEAIGRDFQPDVLAVYGGRMSERSDQELADRFSANLGCRTVFCGPYVSIAPRRWLENTERVEAVIDGEMEFTLLEFVEKRNNDSISGLIYKRGDDVVANSSRAYMNTEQLDSIPFVSSYLKRQVNIRNYRAISEPFPFMDIMSGHGCHWGVCSFCLWVHSYVKGRVYNGRSVERLIGEFEYVRTWMPEVRSIMIQDDTIPEARMIEMCEALIRARIKLVWSCYARAELEAETLRLMKKAGCLNLHVGFESADEVVLKKARKGISRGRMTRFAADARKAGLHIHGDFLIGLDGERRESVLKTVEWAKFLKVDSAQFQMMIPFEGTPLHRSLTEKGQLRDGYPDYPHLSIEEMKGLQRKAYRSFYLRPSQLLKIAAHPKSRLWHYLKVAHKIVPNIIGKAEC